MSGQLPIDRVPRPQDNPEIRDEHRERLARKQATLAQTDRRDEGERQPPAGQPGDSPEGGGPAPDVPAPERTSAQDARDLATDVEDPDDPTAPDTATRQELVRQGTMTGARVEVVDQHEGLSRFGGVGALLRSPLD
jgi:hypothetical protein